MKKLFLVPVLVSSLMAAAPLMADRGDHRGFGYRDHGRYERNFYGDRHFRKHIYRDHYRGRPYFYGRPGRPYVNNYYYHDDGDDLIEWIGGSILVGEILYHLHDGDRCYDECR